MKLAHHDLRLLSVMFSLSRDDVECSLPVLAAVTGLSWPAVDECLSRLESLGLADAENVRLTLPGLTVAAAIRRKPLEERRRLGAAA